MKRGEPGGLRSRGAWGVVRRQQRLLGVLFLGGVILLLPHAQWWKPLFRQFTVDPQHVKVALSPAWVGDETRDAICADLATLPPVSLRDDREIKEWIAKAESVSGWIRKVEKIRRRYPARIELQLELRQPVAVLESQSELWLIDPEGTVVANAESAGDYIRNRRLPVIHRPKGVGPLAANQRLYDEACLEGLRVAMEMAPYKELLPACLEIAVIDVAPLVTADPRRVSDVDLYTIGGIQVQWGRSRASPRFGGIEPSVDQKIRCMTLIASRHPDLDGVKLIQAQFVKPPESDARQSLSPLTDLLSGGGRQS